MEIIDRRQFDAEGNLVASEVTDAEAATPARSEIDYRKLLTEALGSATQHGKELPILDRILVLRSKANTTYEGTNFIIPDIAKKNRNCGIVVAISEVLEKHGVPLGGIFVPANIGVGDLVTFTEYTDEGFQIEREDGYLDEFVLLRIHDVKFVRRVVYGVAGAVS